MREELGARRNYPIPNFRIGSPRRGKCRDKFRDRADITSDAALGGEVVVG